MYIIYICKCSIILIQPCPFRIAVSTSAFLSNIEIQSLMVSGAYNRLTRRILTLPKGTAEVYFCFTSPVPIILKVILRPQLATPQH